MGQRRFRIWTAIAVGVLLLAGAAAGVVHARSQARALFGTDPDAILSQPALVRFAYGRAEPAYQAHCAVCHGADLHGDHGGGTPDLVDRDWLYGTGRVAEIEQTILYGIRSGNPKSHNLAVMPAFGQPGGGGNYKITPLTPGEISDVIAYLHSIEGRPFDVAAGQRGIKIYSNKGQCFDCHGDDAGGDPAIGAPNLTDAIWLYGHGSTADMTRTLIGGRRGVCPAWIGKLKPATIRALAIFISNEAHKNAQGGRG